MPIPDYQTIMLPLLKYLGDGKERTSKDTRDAMAEYFSISEEELKEMLPSKRAPLFANRVAWAIAHMKSAGLLQSHKRGHYNITQRGSEVLSKEPNSVNMKYLKKFPEYYYNRDDKKLSVETNDKQENKIDPKYEETIEETRTPEEIIADSYQMLRDKLKHELLDQIKQCSPAFFERLVVELLVKMGYGGSMEEAAAEVVGKSGDEGIDGIIKEDKLGLDVIYVQAKRWENPVGRPEIQKFAGALMGKRAKKGVFITNSVYTAGAYEYTKSVESKIILIDGNKLAQYMIDFDLGVSREQIFEIKRIDSDYFEED